MNDASPRRDAPHGQLRPGPAARERIAAAVRDRGTAAPAGLPELPADEGLEPVRCFGGDAWLVRETRTGEHFVLHLCPGGSAPERSWARARALVAGMAGCEDPHVVAVHGLLGPAARPVGVVEEYLSGGSLAGRLAGPVRPGPAELCPVLRDAAAGLAVLHGRGRCHGDLTAHRILFRAPWPGPAADGTDVPPPAALGPGPGTGSPPEDVRALGVVAWTALTGRAPGEGSHRVPLSALRPDAPRSLLLAVEAALAEDPADRPGAAELAARLARAAEEEPAPPPAGPRRRPAARERIPLRPAALLAAGAAALIGGVLLGPAATPEHAPAGARPAASAPPGHPAPSGAFSWSPSGGVSRSPSGGVSRSPSDGAPPRPAGTADGQGGSRTALAELVALRGRALRTGDAGLLEQVYAPGAPAAAADRRLLERTGDDGRGAFAELELSVGAVRGVPRPTPDGRPAAAYVAEVHVDGYPGGPGNAPAVVGAGDTWVQTVEVDMVRTDRGWRLGRVVPVPAGGADPARADDTDPLPAESPEDVPAGVPADVPAAERAAPARQAGDTTDPRR